MCVRESRRERAATEREDPFEREERERERESLSASGCERERSRVNERRESDDREGPGA